MLSFAIFMEYLCVRVYLMVHGIITLYTFLHDLDVYRSTRTMSTQNLSTRLVPLFVVTLALHGCGTSPARISPSPNDGPGVRADVAPAPGASVRVGGDRAAMVTVADGGFRAGVCGIDTPLPVGYPAPTPPQAIDLKTYPAVRLAEVVSSGDPDAGMNRTFWPLFNHIKEHDIAMTAPVEMTFRGMPGPEASTPESWSMAFVYRTPELNGTGVEGRVIVRDTEPVTVVAAGEKGDYSMSLVQRRKLRVGQWLASNPQWEPAGDWRALYYNGPALFWWNKWAEVQLPVRPTSAVRRAAASGSPGAE